MKFAAFLVNEFGSEKAMKTFSVMLALVLLLVVVVGIANADKAEDTVNLVDKAVAMFKEQGKDAAL